MRQYQLFDDKVSVYTVTKLTKEIRFLMEDRFKDVWVEGELSNYEIERIREVVAHELENIRLFCMIILKTRRAPENMDRQNA